MLAYNQIHTTPIYLFIHVYILFKHVYLQPNSSYKYLWIHSNNLNTTHGAQTIFQIQNSASTHIYTSNQTLTFALHLTTIYLFYLLLWPNVITQASHIVSPRPFNDHIRHPLGTTQFQPSRRKKKNICTKSFKLLGRISNLQSIKI